MHTLSRAVLLLALFSVLSVSLALGAEAPDSTATTSAHASTTDAAMRPNWFYYVKGEQLVRVDATPLESRESVGAGDLAAHMLWGGGGKTWMTLPGATSEIQIAEPQPRFRVATERVMALMIRLAAFEVRTDKRWAQTNSGRSQEFYKKGIPLDLKKLGDGLYELTSRTPLEPGEYGLALTAAGPVTDFTVVAADSTKAK